MSDRRAWPSWAAPATPAANCCGCCCATRASRSHRSRRSQHAGEFVHGLHPNLRPGGCSGTPLRFTTLSELAACDLLFLALPHGQAQRQIERFAGLAERIVDLSADFRLREPGELPALEAGSLRTAAVEAGPGPNAPGGTRGGWADCVDRVHNGGWSGRGPNPWRRGAGRVSDGDCSGQCAGRKDWAVNTAGDRTAVRARAEGSGIVAALFPNHHVVF